MGLGADVHIDYRETDFTEVLSDIDFVFDTQGMETLVKSLSVLRKGGHVRSIAAMGIEPELQAKADELGVKVDVHLVHSNGDDMAVLVEMLHKGTLKPTIDQVFPFDKLPDAHTWIDQGRTVGKVLVELQ